MANNLYKISPAERSMISAAAIAFPVILLGYKIYGTFSFTFSVPILWQVGYRGKSINSIGLKRRSLFSSAVIGVLLGLALAFFGGLLLKALGMTGYPIDRVREINSFLGKLPIRITFQGEAGYRLLTAGESLKETASYLAYCLFLVGLGEEMFWRGFIQGKMTYILKKHPAIWITALIYGLVHSYIFFIIPVKDGVILIALITLAGALWGYLYDCFENIWGPALSHGIVAFIIWKYFVFSVV